MVTGPAGEPGFVGELAVSRGPAACLVVGRVLTVARREEAAPTPGFLIPRGQDPRDRSASFPLGGQLFRVWGALPACLGVRVSDGAQTQPYTLGGLRLWALPPECVG